MKIQIWIKKEDAISGNITTYHTHPVIGVGYEDYVQVSITQDEFVQLEDQSIEENDWKSDYWLTKQYNRNRQYEDQVDNMDDISNKNKLEEKIKQARIVIDELQDYMKVTGGEFKDWFNNLSERAKTMYNDELERKK